MIKFLRFVPIQLTFFLIIGILFGNFIDFKPIYIIGSLVFLLICIAIFYVVSNKYFSKIIFIFTLLVFTTFVFIGIASITLNKEINNNRHYSNIQEFSEVVPLEAILKIKKELKPSAYFKKYEAIVKLINNEHCIGKILVNVKKDSTVKVLKVDDEILTTTQFFEIQNSQNPYEFNYRDYLKNQQIYHQVSISKESFLIKPNPKSTIYGIAANIRFQINKSLIKSGFKNDELALINALLLGQRQTISEDLLTSYTDAGAVHILAVSGLHIGIILLFLIFIFRGLNSFKNGKLITAVLIISILWFYAIIAGLSASVVRAVAMFTALSVGLLLNKPSNVYNTLFISMFFLLLFHPFYLFEVGFQLSYLAVFSIVWIQQKLENLWVSKIWLFRKMWQLFSVSIAAQLGILPLSLFYFHQFPTLFFVANMLIIPFLGFILIAGIIIIILSICDVLPQALADFYIFILQKMNEITTFVSSIDSFIIRDISMSLLLMLAIYFVIILLFKWVEKKKYSRLMFVFFSIIMVQAILIYEKYERQSKKELIVFNSPRKSTIGLRNGDKITFTASSLGRITKSYLIGTGIKDITFFKQSTKVLNFKDETVLIVDSLGYYNFNSIKPTIILLQHSPKINLNRLIENVKPTIIVADATNYKSYIKFWEETSRKNKTPFYTTVKKGAYILKD
jgi:competence protein ComEC